MPDTETQETIAEAVDLTLILLPGWEAEAWRRQAMLADNLAYLATQLRAASMAKCVDEMRTMHEAGVG
jgi:hypothetical protein